MLTNSDSVRDASSPEIEFVFETLPDTAQPLYPASPAQPQSPASPLVMLPSSSTSPLLIPPNSPVSPLMMLRQSPASPLLMPRAASYGHVGDSVALSGDPPGRDVWTPEPAWNEMIPSSEGLEEASRRQFAHILQGAGRRSDSHRHHQNTQPVPPRATGASLKQVSALSI